MTVIAEPTGMTVLRTNVACFHLNDNFLALTANNDRMGKG